jgi:hypothetical protein
VARLARCGAVAALALLPLCATLPASAAQRNEWQNVLDGKCMDADNGSGLNDGAGVNNWGCVTGKSNQEWIWNTVGFSGTHPLVQFKLAARSSKCLDVNTPDSYIQIWQCGTSGKTNQQWEVITQSNGDDELESVALGGDCLKGAPGDGTPVTLKLCDPSNKEFLWHVH